MTKVLFRKCDDGSIDAIFPEIPADFTGVSITCYAHIGQHSSCDTEWVQRTQPAKPSEYADLLAELKAYGDGTVYNDLKIIQRMPSNALDTRCKALRGIA